MTVSVRNLCNCATLRPELPPRLLQLLLLLPAAGQGCWELSAFWRAFKRITTPNNSVEPAEPSASALWCQPW